MRKSVVIAVLAMLALVAAACADEPAAEPAPADPAADDPAGDGDGAGDDGGEPTDDAGDDAADDEPTEEPEPEYETEELVIGLVAPNQVYTAMYVALEQGWFADESFDAEIVLTQSSTGSVQQTAAGSVHVAGAVPDAVVLGVEQGAAVSIMAVTIQGSPLGVVARPEVEDWEDLRGETIGVSALAGGEIALLRRLLAEHGLNEGDYDVIIAGPTPGKAAALNEGSVAAAVLFSPADYNLESQGFTILGNTAELPMTEQMPLAVYVVNDAWAQQNDRGVRLARALVRANEWLQDPANRDEAVRIFSEAAEQPAEHVETTFAFWFDELEIGTPDGMVQPEEIQAVLEMMRDDGDLQEPLPEPEKFIDTSYIEDALAGSQR